jgi:hypothetical protein
MKVQYLKMMLIGAMVMSLGVLAVISQGNNAQIQTQKAQLKKLSSKIRAAKMVLKNPVQYEKLNVTDEVLTDAISKPVSTFFDAYYSYDSSKEYNSRSNRIGDRGIADSDVLNSKIFETDKQQTGEDYVDNNSIKSKFLKAQTYYLGNQGDIQHVRVIVEYSVTGNGSNGYVDSSAAYDLSFDAKTDQITAVSYLYGVK